MSFRISRSGRTSRIAKIREKLAPWAISPVLRTSLVIALITLCSLLVFWASLKIKVNSFEPISAQLDAPPIWPLSSTAVGEAGSNRAIYPYSVIPGGAESRDELQRAMADPVVAQHYSDFDVAKVRRITLDTPKLMYVSYRIGNKVFWTKRQLTLHKGETMLTDGHSMARTRCGNRVSVLPVRPNAPAEPMPADFDAPVLAPTVSTPYLAAFSAPPVGLPGGPAIQSAGTPGSSFTPVAPFFPLPGGGGISGKSDASTPPPGGGGGTPPPGGGGGTPPPGGGGTPPPVGIPEPGTTGMILLGMAAVASLVLVRRSKKT